jgi:hypothetical protein
MNGGQGQQQQQAQP